MTRRAINYETLNAYVDGELNAERAADVLAAAAEDPAIARELSSLSRVKASLSHDVSPSSLDIVIPRRRRRWPNALAACLALFLAVATAGLTLTFRGDSRGLDVAWVQRVHGSWSIADGSIAPTSISGRDATIDPAAYVPDLSAAKLSIVHTGWVAGPNDDRALLIGYRGTRGCKVTLIVVPDADAFADELVAFDSPTNRGYSWRAGRRGYVVFAEGMAEARFSLIARSLRDASLRHLPLNQGTQHALAESRAKSVPCRA